MPDICDLILDDHETLRRRFAELDEERDSERSVLDRVWAPLGVLLDLHAAAEEKIFYPQLLARGEEGRAETLDAINDHNAIRDAVQRAGCAPTGSDEWWGAVEEARKQNSDHMGEEERGALADFRSQTSREVRGRLGAEFASFKEAHAGGRDLRITDESPEGYVEQEAP